MKAHVPSLMLAGTGSGCGKTSLSCAILKALKNRGLSPAAFKCGPDYIDPMFHRDVIESPSYNLDSFFLDDNTLKYLLWKNSKAAELSIIECVMGFYDGRGLLSTEGSSFEISKITGSPVVLIVDAKGAALSVLAVLQGFLDFCPENNIKGVILNRCTAMSYKLLSEEITGRFSGKIRPLGYMPPMPECSLDSRRLGLVSPEETENIKKKLEALAEQAEKSIDIEGILELSEAAEPLSFEKPVIRSLEKIRIALARDRAFCFYYEDNLKLLEEMGAEIVEFSPLSDAALPKNIDGLYLGGGYPEIHAEELSKNKSLLEDIKNSVESGLPTIAECGGFMYLTEAIEAYPMASVIKGKSFDTGKLSRFGYITLKAEKDCLLCRAGEKIPAHEFHYYDAEEPGKDFVASKSGGRSWSCVHSRDTLYAGFPHFHFYANLSFAENFYKACLRRKND